VDLTDTIVPKSDQLNAEDMLTGPRTVTITEVRRGSDEQPVNIHLAELPGRPFRPSKTVLRILVTAWGKDSDAYTGRRLTLYRDPEVRFGGMDVGGIRVSHMSHIKAPLKLALTVSKGRKAPYVVQPLADAPAPAKANPDGITDAQLKAVGAGLAGLGITDRDAMLATVAQVIDREIKSSKELTQAEANTVLDWIKHEEAADAEPTLPGADQ
jgi:hypothetical protein